MDERLISGAGFIAHIQNSCSTEEHSGHATHELPSEASRSILKPSNESVASQVEFPRSLSSLELCFTMCLPLFNSKASDTLSMERVLWAMKGGITKKTWSELIAKNREHNHLFFLRAPINLEDEVQSALEGFNVEGLFLSARIGEETVHYSSISAIIRLWLADLELLHEARAFNECYVNPYVASTRDLATAASTVGAYSQFGTELYASLGRTFASWSPTLGGQAPPLFLNMELWLDDTCQFGNKKAFTHATLSTKQFTCGQKDTRTSNAIRTLMLFKKSKKSTSNASGNFGDSALSCFSQGLYLLAKSVQVYWEVESRPITVGLFICNFSYDTSDPSTYLQQCRWSHQKI